MKSLVVKIPVGNVYTVDDVPDLVGYINRNKRVFTRLSNQLMEDLEKLEVNYSTQLAKGAEKDYLESLKPKLESLNERLDTILSITDLPGAQVTIHEATQTEINSKYDSVTDKYSSVMSANSTPTDRPQAKAVTEQDG